MNHKAKKRLGQNFLNNRGIINKIVNTINLEEPAVIVEVGPGKGILTEQLLELNAHVIAYEIDDDLIPSLKDKFKDKDIEIIHDDFLKRNLQEDLKDHLHKNIYIVANLPYYITTPIITKLTDEKIKIKQMVLMVQKEVGDRMTAKSNNKAYSSISVYLDYYYDVKKEFIVLAKYFTPKPKVDSVVISFNEKAKKYDVKNEEQFFRIIKEAFTFKRKNLKNNLFMYDLNKIEKLLQDVNKNLTYRAEQLTIEDFVYLSNNLGDKNE